MKKREIIFLGIYVLSLTLILICPMMVQWTFASVFEVDSPEEIIFLEQGRQNQEFGDHTSQALAFARISVKSGLIRNTTWDNAKASRSLTWIFPADPKATIAQVLLQCLPRASPP